MFYDNTGGLTPTSTASGDDLRNMENRLLARIEVLEKMNNESFNLSVIRVLSGRVPVSITTFDYP